RPRALGLKGILARENSLHGRRRPVTLRHLAGSNRRQNGPFNRAVCDQSSAGQRLCFLRDLSRPNVVPCPSGGFLSISDRYSPSVRCLLDNAPIGYFPAGIPAAALPAIFTFWLGLVSDQPRPRAGIGPNRHPRACGSLYLLPRNWHICRRGLGACRAF